MRSSLLLAFGLVPFLLLPARADDGAPRDLSVEQTDAWNTGSPHPGSLKVSLAADRADATYAIGETAHLLIKVNEDAYVAVFSVGPTGKVHQLFPNEFQRDNRVEAERPVEIGGGSTGARINVSGPVGVEVVKVIASNQPFSVVPERELEVSGPFPLVEGGVRTLARDLDVVANDASAERKVAVRNYTLHTVHRRTGDNGAGVMIEPAAGGLFTIPTQQPFPLLIAVDRQVYKVGDRVTLAVTTLQACDLTVLDVTTSGAVRQLFPNKVNHRNAINANQTVLVSGGPSPVALQVVPPEGTEQIIAVCSTDHAALLSQKVDLAQLFPPVGERADVARDLAVVADRPAGTTAIAATTFSVEP